MNETEELVETEEDRKPVLREVVMEFHRWANVPTFHQIVIERDGVKRTYQRPSEGRYTPPEQDHLQPSYPA